MEPEIKGTHAIPEQNNEPGSARTNNVIRTIATITALLLPVLFIVYIICRYGANVVFYDEFSFIDEYQRLLNGENVFQILYQQHNEHRLLFPKMVMYLSALVTGYDTKVQMFFGAAYACFAYFALIKLTAGKKIRNMTLSDTAVSVVIGMCLFSACQWENIIWGMQSAWFMVSAGVVGVFWFLSLYLKSSQRKYYVLMLVFATISCFSSLQGLAVWIALAVTIAALVITQPSQKKTIWIPAALTGVIEIVLYFWGLQKMDSTPVPDSLLSLVTFFFQMVGSPFRFNTDWLQCALGAVFFLLTVVLVIYLIRNRRYGEYIGQIGIIVFSFGVDAMCAIGRGGLSAGVSSRYITYSVLAVAAVISIVYKLFTEKVGTDTACKPRRFINQALLSVVVLGAITVYQSFDTVALNKIPDRSYNEMTLRNYRDFPLSTLQQTYPFGSYDEAYETIGKIKNNHLSCFSSTFAERWEEVNASGYTIIPGLADCDFNGLSWEADNQIIYLRSWAIITESPIPSSNVLVKINDICYQTENQIPRPDVAEVFGNENYALSGFEFQKNADVLHSGINTINVLVISEDGTKAYETPDSYIYKNDDGSLFRCDSSGMPL